MFLKKHTKNKTRLDRVAKLYLAVKFFSTLYFTYPIFYGYASQVITPIQVGIFFSVLGVSGFIAEIPTGVIADKYSRKFCGLFGTTMTLVAPLVVFFGHTFAAYLIASLFYGVGRAFLNGTLDSLVYDHRNVSKAAYRRVNALEISYGQTGILASAAAGGILFSLSPGLPFIIEATAGLICLVLIAYMSEQYKGTHIKPTASHAQHLIQSGKHLFATGYLRVTVFMGVVFSVMLGMCIQFVNEATMIEHGLEPTARGLLISGAGIATLIILNLFLLRVLKSDVMRLIYMGVGAVVAYGLMSIESMPLFLFGYLFWCCLNATSSFIKLMLQDHIPGSHRSTILSGFKTLAILVGLGASTGTGLIVEWGHTPRIAYILFAAIAVVILLPCTLWLVIYLKKYSLTAITEEEI